MKDQQVKDFKCIRCGEVKLLTQFHLQPRRKHGRDSRCKACVSKLNKLYQQKKEEAKKDARIVDYCLPHY